MRRTPCTTLPTITGRGPIPARKGAFRQGVRVRTNTGARWGGSTMSTATGIWFARVRRLVITRGRRNDGRKAVIPGRALARTRNLGESSDGCRLLNTRRGRKRVFFWHVRPAFLDRCLPAIVPAGRMPLRVHRLAACATASSAPDSSARDCRWSGACLPTSDRSDCGS